MLPLDGGKRVVEREEVVVSSEVDMEAVAICRRGIDLRAAAVSSRTDSSIEMINRTSTVSVFLLVTIVILSSIDTGGGQPART